MDLIDKYKRVEEDQQLGKGKAKVVLQDIRDFRSDKYNNNCPQRDFTGQSGIAAGQVVNTLVRGGRLMQFLYHPNGQGDKAGSGSQRDASSKPPLGTTSVILVTLGRTGSHPSKVLSIAQPLTEDSSPEPKRSRMEVRLALSFSDEDKVETVQPHDDGLVFTLRIWAMM
ncbi:uncharacterized protein LOC142640034 [Castanea sativa]|uniref:uncharacterized protein LOC142640034 n=1 Tax=Castanea sativa TaxID=21020 RepID=UPI003F64BF22